MMIAASAPATITLSRDKTPLRGVLNTNLGWRKPVYDPSREAVNKVKSSAGTGVYVNT
ncbi:hypothetical protein ACLHZY_14645 [Aeromonas media]|uniref:hypothetical protein n=1 Tax=Aeromonas rivipollensis TaxID=948519 RepID=UPI003D24A222